MLHKQAMMKYYFPPQYTLSTQGNMKHAFFFLFFYISDVFRLQGQRQEGNATVFMDVYGNTQTKSDNESRVCEVPHSGKNA